MNRRKYFSLKSAKLSSLKVNSKKEMVISTFKLRKEKQLVHCYTSNLADVGAKIQSYVLQWSCVCIRILFFFFVAGTLCK